MDFPSFQYRWFICKLNFPSIKNNRGITIPSLSDLTSRRGARWSPRCRSSPPRRAQPSRRSAQRAAAHAPTTAPASDTCSVKVIFKNPYPIFGKYKPRVKRLGSQILRCCLLWPPGNKIEGQDKFLWPQSTNHTGKCITFWGCSPHSNDIKIVMIVWV